MVSVSVRYLFYQPMDENMHEENCDGLFFFPPKKTLANMEKGLFDWSINYRVAVCRQSKVSIEF